MEGAASRALRTWQPRLLVIVAIPWITFAVGASGAVPDAVAAFPLAALTTIIAGGYWYRLRGNASFEKRREMNEIESEARRRVARKKRNAALRLIEAVFDHGDPEVELPKLLDSWGSTIDVGTVWKPKPSEPAVAACPGPIVITTGRVIIGQAGERWVKTWRGLATWSAEDGQLTLEATDGEEVVVNLDGSDPRAHPLFLAAVLDYVTMNHG